MRLAMLAAFLFAVCSASSSAFAQDRGTNRPWCLMRGPTHHCLYDSPEQCQSARHGSTDFCEENHWNRR
jgi:acetoin utilization deacetylase AcuC-like enzyme